MGGDTVSPVISSLEEESSSEQEFPEVSPGLPIFLRSYRTNGLDTKLEDDEMNGKKGLVFGEFDDVGHRVTSDSLDFEAGRRRKRSVCRGILQSYDEIQRRSENLEEAKIKILSYTPGAWIEKVGGMSLSDYNVPQTTSLLLIGPRGAGKSSLVNRISRVFEVDKFAPERAQVSYNLSTGDGTLFLKESMIPRDSTSFCLYDTRSFCNDSSENFEMLKHWMTKGVRHGELVIRNSDSSSLKTRMKWKARQSGHCSSEIRAVNFVIFVVDGLSVLKSMNSNEEAERQYTQMIATIFNYPFLSFRDDKPVIVVTHGDLLSLADRARVRIHLGELLGISSTKQIFDIPENCDPATELAVVDMLRYSLEHADSNLQGNDWSWLVEVCQVYLPACLFMLIILGIAIISAHIHYRIHYGHHMDRASESNPHMDWHGMRHLWSGEDYD